MTEKKPEKYPSIKDVCLTASAWLGDESYSLLVERRGASLSEADCRRITREVELRLRQRMEEIRQLGEVAAENMRASGQIRCAPSR